MDQLHVVLGLQGMQLAHQGIKAGLGRQLRRVARGVMHHALLAACDRQQLAVQLYVPIPGQAGFLEGGIEGQAMAIAFGIGQRAIDVEDQGLQHGAQHSPGRSISSSHGFLWQ
jgi:hypothetical protein